MKSIVRTASERLLLYFPLISMSFFALGTYWLVKSTPATTVAEVKRALVHEPDYFMHNFSVKTFDATGRVRTEVRGAKAQHFPDTGWLEVDAILVRSFDAQGQLTTASAARGLINENGSEVQLMGGAVVVRDSSTLGGTAGSPRVEYRSEFLHAFLNAERVSSHLPVALQRGQDRLSADRMEYDDVDQVLNLTGHVRGSMAAPVR